MNSPSCPSNIQCIHTFGSLNLAHGCITTVIPDTPVAGCLWRVCRFFVGYISRPAGALLFGHLGDTKGRGTCLLISVLVMGIPTVSSSLSTCLI